MAILLTMPVTSALGHIFNISWPFGIVEMALLGYFAYLVFSNLRSIRRAEWVVVIAMTALTLGSLLWVYLHKYHLDTFATYENVLKSAVMLSAPVMLLLYVALSYKQILLERQEEERKVLRVTEEKRELLERQNERLESQVAERTRDLEATLTHLRDTQAQLIQSEKMASLGELTAGIAHEIQNPLNFVNNFSELNRELLEELQQTLPAENGDEATSLINDIRDNEEKILHHGRRADAIVKGMLQHSRSGTGVKEPTDLNALVDEYLRLAYHGLRAKDKSFNATFTTDLDAALPNVEVVPQDLGRVVLNLINNAFYAVSEKQRQGDKDYVPTVTVRTSRSGDRAEILVTDNGAGIPDAIREKIFQPFFTTKPTGQGTGLGLSLSYDIVKAHGGTLTIGPRTAEGTTFRIALPLPESSDGKS
jgi:signal transduction histidine kinase